MSHNFKIGQKVIALTNPTKKGSQPRVKGKIYTVTDVSYCRKCGVQLVNINNQTSGSADCLVCECGDESLVDNKYWTFSRLFAPLDEIDSLIEKAIESEDYELAGELTKQNS